MQFFHVLGHQDRKSDKPLTLPERLNIDCDVRAAQLPPPANPHQLRQNPRNEAGYPHLCIQGHIVIRRLQAHLRDAATQEAYFQYLQDKFQWTMSPTDVIHWQGLQLALRRFNRSDRTIITKFIHEWLPLQDRHHVHSASSDHLCPSCHRVPETVHHFLACTHPDRQMLWTELDANLLKYFLRQQIDSSHHELFQYGLLKGRNASTDFDPQPYLTEPLQTLNAAQQCLGWQQLYYGRLSPHWILLHNKSYPQLNGLHYYTKCVTLIWQTVLKQWKLRNQHLYPATTLQEDRSQIQAIVNQILHDANQDPNLQALVANVTAEQVMTKPIRKLRQWITNSTNHIRNHHKAAQLRAKLKTRDIRQYFIKLQPKTISNSTAKNLLRPP